MQQFSAVSDQSLYDVCLNTYGDLGFLYKLLQDNGVPSVKDDVVTGQIFLWDDSLVINQQINQAFAASGIKYATDIHPPGAKANYNPIITEDGFDIITEDGKIIIAE